MITFNDETKKWFKLFEEKFDDIVPLRQISGSVTNDQIIDAIKKCIEEDKNILPAIFGYGNKNDRTY